MRRCQRIRSDLANRISDLREDMYTLDRLVVIERWKYWSPKGLAAVCFTEALFTHNGYLMFWALGIMVVLLIIDAVWKGRALRQEVAQRSAGQLWELVQAVPALWDKESKSRSPDLALAEVLAVIEERRQQIGQVGVKDLGVFKQALQADARKAISVERPIEVPGNPLALAPRF